MSQRTKLFSGFGLTPERRRHWKTGTALEVFKFLIYLVVPVGAAVVYTNPETIKKYIKITNYVAYPKQTIGKDFNKQKSSGNIIKSDDKNDVDLENFKK